MPSTSLNDTDPLLVSKNDPATQKANNRLRRTPFRVQYQQNLFASVESFLETDIPSPSLDHDPEIERLMSPTGSFRQSRPEFESPASTLRASSEIFYSEPDRDSFGSISEDFYDDLAVDHACVRQPYQPYQTNQLLQQLCQSDEQSRSQILRPASVLPAARLEYRPSSYTSSTGYSAPLHTNSASWSSNRSTLSSSNLDIVPASSKQFNTLQRYNSFAKRSVTPLAVESLCEDLYREVFAYESSCCSSEARPSTPVSSLLPSRSFSSSAGTSPTSILTHASSQNMAQGGILEHHEKAEEKKTRFQPKHIALGHAQLRKISAPVLSTSFPAVNNTAATSYRCTPSSRGSPPSPSQVPTQPTEVSMFDDSDDEEGIFFHHVRKIKSAVSLQNLHTRSRAPAESSARTTPPMPSAFILAADGTSDEMFQRSSRGSINLHCDKESNKSNSLTTAVASPAWAPVHRGASNDAAETLSHSTTAIHKRASLKYKSSSPVAARLQKNLSVCSKRSNIASSASSSPTPTHDVPTSSTPKLISTADRSQSHMSWYTCFSRPEPTDANVYGTSQQQRRNNKVSKRGSKSSTPGKIRVFFKRVFR